MFAFPFQGLSMRQIRFRFDGQPINEADTPAQVRRQQRLSEAPVGPVGHLHALGGLSLGGSAFKFRDSLFPMGRKPSQDVPPCAGRCRAGAGPAQVWPGPRHRRQRTQAEAVAWAGPASLMG